MTIANVFYNPADIDSVIAAAVLVSSNMNDEKFKCYPVSKLNDNMINGAISYWVGVEPTLDTVKKLKACSTHIGFFTSKDSINKKVAAQFAKCVYAEDMPHVKENEEGPIVPANVFYVIYCEMNCLYGWYVSFMINKFKYGHEMPKEEMAWIYSTYNKAISFLSGGSKKFSIDDYTCTFLQPDIDAWDAVLKNLKAQLPSIMFTTDIKIDDHFVSVPLINVNQGMSPWVIRFLSNIYDYIITYEQRQMTTVYTVFSRLAGFEDVVLKQLVDSKTRICLSRHM